ncbi:restriction endonuclease subunit S [Streptomyces asoensis]|uniref:restriction endonuclease subunit S n=1 Tax=Streptomyces asoensis TaxID=249586 RepID=UPI003403D1A6
MTRTTTVRAAAEVALGRQRAPQHDAGPHMVSYLRAANVKDGVLDLTDVKQMNFSPAEQQIFSLRPGDVLVTEGSGSLRAVGASAVWRGEIEETICFQNTLLRMRPRDGITDGRFLEWWARSAFGSGLFASIATGANIYHISAERVRSLPIELPPLEKQRRIADFLDAETARIDKIAVLQKRVSDRLTERDNALRDGLLDRLIDAEGEIPLRRLTSGIEQGASPQCDATPRESRHEWGVLKLSAVKRGTFDPGENKKLPDDAVLETTYEVRPGDFLVTRANTPNLVGDVAVVGRNAERLLLPDLIYRVRLANDVNAEFISQVALGRRLRTLIESVARGSSQSMVKLRGEDIKSWPIPRATRTQQDELVKAMHDGTAATTQLKSLVRQQLTLLAERRQALITAAVTGQFDVSSASGRNVTEGVSV